MKNLSLLSLILTLFISFNNIQAQSGEALNLDGIDDHISISHDTLLGITNQGFTIECFYKASTPQPNGTAIFSKSSGSGASWNGFQLFIQNNNVALEFSDGTNYKGPYQTSSVNVNDGNWHHISFSIDISNTKASASIDNQGGTTTYNGSFAGMNITNTNDLLIGINRDSTTFLEGTIDEVRIWNRYMDICERRVHSLGEIGLPSNNLTGYLKLDQGIASGDNTAITTLIDSSINNISASLINYSLNGNISNFIAPGSFPSGTYMPEYNFPDFEITASDSIINRGEEVILSITGGNANSYQWNNPISSTDTIISVFPSETYTYGAKGFGVINCISTNKSITIKVRGNSLGFSGGHAKVLPDTNKFNTNAITIESWVKPESSAIMSTIAGTSTGKFNLIVGDLINGSGGFFDQYVTFFINNSTNGVLTGNTDLNDGLWHHVAATYDGQTMNLYIDGILDGSLNYVNSIDYLDTLLIGKSPDPSSGNFIGQMDEYRIWDRALCQAEIQHNMNAEIFSPQVNLLAYYKFNQGIDKELNTSSDYLFDSSGNSYHASLYNFSLSGPTSNWTSQSTIVTDSIGPLYNNTLSISGNDLLCNGDTSILTVSGGSNYTWTTGAINNSITVGSINAGLYGYSVVEKDINDCVTAMDAINITVLELDTNSINALICNGDEYNVGSNIYTTSGIFIDTLSSIHGCDSIITTTLLINSLDTMINISDDTLTANATGVNYQWLDCDNGNQIISGANNQTFVASTSGNYACVITDSLCSDTTSCINLITTSSNSNQNYFNETNLIIYPNPSNGTFNLKLDNFKQTVDFKITDLLGREIINGKFKNNTIIDLNEQQNGVYFVSFKISNSLKVIKLIKE